jgi:hypothetical protein
MLLLAFSGVRPQNHSSIAATRARLAFVLVRGWRSTDSARPASEGRDAISGPFFQTGLAQIEAHAGAPEEAIKRLRNLLSIPSGQRISIARLKIDPVWDSIRNRPDFQQLLSGPEQIGPNK